METSRTPRTIVAVVLAAAVLCTMSLLPAGAIAPPPTPTFERTFGTKGDGPGQMNQPGGVAVGADGTVYVADTGNHRIQRFDGATGIALGMVGGGNGTSNGQFSIPYGVTVDAVGDVWVADSGNHRIQRFNAAGAWQQTIGTQGSGPGQVLFPYAVAVSGDDVYVADSLNHRIQQFTRSGAFVRTWGSKGTANGQFDQPGDLDVNRQGEVFVADTYNQRVQVFSSTGAYLRSWATPSSGAVQGIDVDGAGHVWTSDSLDLVQRFGRDGALLDSFGSSGSGPADIPDPYGIEVRGGRVFVVSLSLHKAVSFTTCGANAAFSDVPADHPFFDAICWGAATNLVRGYGDGTFRSTAPVTRQAAAAYLHRLLEAPSGPFPDPGFSDVDGTHPFRTQIWWLVDEGIAKGFPDGTFRPVNAVSRQALAAYLYETIGSPPGPFADPGFSDVPADHPFAIQIAWLASTGITQGYADGTFRPTAPVSRQAMVQFLAELDGRYLH